MRNLATRPAHVSRSTQRRRLQKLLLDSVAPQSEQQKPYKRYTQEGKDFIVYHRDDCNEEWTVIAEAYRRQFPSERREGEQGVQSIYYRVNKKIKQTLVRERKQWNHNGLNPHGLLVLGRQYWQKYDWIKDVHR